MLLTFRAFAQTLIATLSVFCFSQTFGQTNIPAGNVSGTWSKALSPYIVNGNLTIAANQKLTIQPGVEVRFSGSYSLNVHGCLDATGTASDSIRFTVTDKTGFSTNTHTGWLGVRFQGVVHADSSAIVYCVLEYGKATGFGENGQGGAIYATGFGRIKLQNSTLKNNRASYGGAIFATEASKLNMKDLLLQGNSVNERGAGIFAYLSDLTLTRCRLIKNSTTFEGGGIYAVTANLNIRNSLIVGNSGGAIEGYAGSKISISQSTVAGNTGTPDGFDLYDTDLTCTNSILWNKSINNTYNEISALGNSKVKLIYCVVKGDISNEWNVKNSTTNDPKFIDLNNLNVNPGWTGYPAKDATRSSAIDAGDPTSPHDPDGTIADMGALPFTQTSSAFPTVSFAGDTTLGLVPLDIQFNNYTTQAQGSITTWQWKFGDQTTSTEKNPVHQYAAHGVYDVKLVATNQDGKKDSVTFVKYIHAIGGTIINSTAVEGTWTKQNSPYNIFNSITIEGGKTLTIEPGVNVNFFGHYTLHVNGNLIARGTASDSIVFDKFDDKSSWHSIRIENVGAGSDSTLFEYCRIAHTAYIDGDVTLNGGNAVYVKNFDKVRVSHSLLRNNKGGRGAGIYADHANIKINNNVIRNNSTNQYGGGICIEDGSPLIKGNRIERNYGEAGGGIWLWGSNGQVEDNTISYNSSYGSGAGASITNGSNCTLLRNVISYNESGHDGGGGVMISASSPKIINNTIAFNKAEQGEGVLIAYGYAAPEFVNTIIYGNRDRYQDVNENDEVYVESSGNPIKFYNCDIQAGIDGIGFHTGIVNTIAKDNIDAPPLFRNESGNDLSLTWTNFPANDNSRSPCIDEGILDTPHDPDGSTADIGALYFPQTQGNFPPRVDFAADTLLGFNTLDVAFSDLSDPGNGDITEWLWAFGDGVTSTVQHPSHKYHTEGRFDVTLTVKDENGFEKKFSKEKYVRIIAGVYVKGIVQGTFDAPRYIVGGDLLVESSKALEIKPGVEMMFLNGFKLEVQGALRAIGTKAGPIVFTSYDTTGLDLNHATTRYSEVPLGWKGIYVYASGAQDSTVIDHCSIQFADNLGVGAIHAFAANGAAGMRISNCEISYNSTQGITVFSNDIIIRNNYIHHNYASTYQKGAGIYFYAGNPKVINNIIANNESAAEGGGMCMDWDSRPLLIGNVITYNKAWRAGGICDYAGGFEVINNTIAFNTSTGSIGGGYYTLYAGDTKFTNSIIANNLPTQVEIEDWTTTIGFRNCILQGGKEAIKMYGDNVFLYENTIADDPKLITGKNGHGRLMPGSPAVNEGTTTGITPALPAYDVVGNARVAGSQIDIGAYEYVADPPLSLVSTIADENKEEDFVPFLIPLKYIFGYKYEANFLSYRIEEETPLLNVEVRDQTLYLKPVVDKFGDQTVKLIASTGVSEITTTFVIHIAPVDDPPEFRVDPSYTEYEDYTGFVSYGVDVVHHYGEEDQTQLFKLEPATIDFATIQFGTHDGSLNIFSKPNLYGTQKFTLTLTEGGQSRSKDFTFTVKPVNDAPVITINQSPISISVDELKVIPVTVSDVDSDNVTFLSAPSNYAITMSSTTTGFNQYNITITGQLVGTSGINMAARDGQTVTNLTIPVTVEPVMGLEGESLSYAAYPNPAAEKIVVRAKVKSTIVMYNASGLVVLEAEMDNSDITLQVGHLKPGLYLLRVDDGMGARMFRVFKQ